jgi:poly(ADP-ribose) glycohydrolase
VPILPVRVQSASKIEEAAQGLLQIDFANKYIGGGVLRHGTVQEEIRFAICPDLIVGRLFTQALRDNESLVVFGVEQFSRYSGYAGSFTCAGAYVDETPVDSSGHMQVCRGSATLEKHGGSCRCPSQPSARSAAGVLS